MKLTNEEYFFLKSELDKTSIMTEEQLTYIKSAHKYMYLTVHDIPHSGRVLHTQSCWFYTLENDKLNKFICDKFEEPIYNLYTMHRLIYTEGGECKHHKDRFNTHKTVSIILSDDFDGGDMFINYEKVEMNKNGEYVIFNGGSDWHSVDKITRGLRDVLIVWFSKKQSKFSLI